MDNMKNKINVCQSLSKTIGVVDKLMIQVHVYNVTLIVTITILSLVVHMDNTMILDNKYAQVLQVYPIVFS